MRSHSDGLYVMQLVVAATNQNGLYKKHMFCRKNVNKIKMWKIVSPAPFWMPWKFTRDYNRQCLLVQTFCTNSVAANCTNFFILSKWCRTDDFSHFYFVDIFPTEHVLFVNPVLIGLGYVFYPEKTTTHKTTS
jgi:hypothetical protein